MVGGELEPRSGWVVVEDGDGFVKTGLDDCGHCSIDGLVAGRHRCEVSLPHALSAIPPL
jgi:hypothetical protein